MWMRARKMRKEQRVGHREKAVHAHDEDDGKRRARINRTQRPCEKRIGLGRHDPVFLLAEVAQGLDGARITIRATGAEDDEDRVCDRTSP